ncbi:MAG: KEOPS complex kinase/ATPase Bud32 [Nitrososphaerales archaeon]
MQPISEFEVRNGAEAIIDLVEWHGEALIRKRRVPKYYRNPKLDQGLRSRRTKEETVILHAAKLSGVNCPRVVFADPTGCEILMEYIQGIHIKDITENPVHKRDSGKLYMKLGEAVARMHLGKIAHGDLTTKNILVKKGGIFIIDFGLSFFSERIEDRAADLHLLKQAFRSTNPPAFSSFAFSSVMKGYKEVMGRKYAQLVAAQVLEIERRGRYARVD